MIFIGTDQGIYRWFSGAQWPVFHSLQDQTILALAADGRGGMVALDSEGRVLETNTNGMEWRELSRPSGSGRPTTLSLFTGKTSACLLATASPLALYHRWLGTSVPDESRANRPLQSVARLWRSSASGAVATVKKAPKSKSSAWNSVAVPSVALAGTLNGIRILRTPAAGAPWLAAVTGDGLWRSGDLGASWTRCNVVPTEILAVKQEGATVACATGQGVWLSQDAGETFSAASAGLENAPQVTAIEIKPGNPKVLLAGAGQPQPNGGTIRNALYESKDGGQTWKQVTRGFPVDLEADPIVDIRFDPASPECALAVLASGELWKTFTDGFWWEPLARQIQGARTLCAVA